MNAGGDFFLAALCSLNVSQAHFANSSALKGSNIYGEALLSGSIVLNNIIVSDVVFTPKANLIKITSGSLMVTDSLFRDISMPLFELVGTSSTLNNITVSGITCQDSSLPSCLIDIKTANLQLLKSNISNIASNINLITATSANAISIQNTSFYRIRSVSSTQSNLNTFAISINKVQNFSLQGCALERFSRSFLVASESRIEISNSAFSNLYIQQNISRYQNRQIQFVQLTSSNSSIQNSSFISNSPNYNVNGGVIYF